MPENYDVVVIGGGPGGYSAAIRAGQLGLKTILIEKNEIGGTCLNVGCIPTKHFVHYSDVYSTIKNSSKLGIHTTLESIDLNMFQKEKNKVVMQLKSGVTSILKSHKVEIVKGFATIKTKNIVMIKNGQDEQSVSTKNIIVATGSSPRELPSLPFNGETVLSSNDILSLSELPKKMAIIGGGVIGIEFASIFSQLDVEVHIIEAMPKILMAEDEDIVQYLKNNLKKNGVTVYEHTSYSDSVINDNQVELILKNNEGQNIKLQVDQVLVAIGRTRNTSQIGLENADVHVINRQIEVNEFMQTNIPSIYSVGDINPGWQLAHVAFEEGIVAAENIAGMSRKMDYKVVPRCIYTSPEISTVGLTEREAKKIYSEVEVHTFPLAANSKAMMAGKKEGIAKIVLEKEYKEILGISLVGEGVNELISEGSLAIYLEATAEELANLIHPHPSLSEIFKEVSLLAMDKPLHITN